MNAAEFFPAIAKPNYNEFLRNPEDLRLLWNAVVSMNTVAEYVALERLDHRQFPRTDLLTAVNKIRDDFPALSRLNYYVVNFKHVKKLKKDHGGIFATIATSPGVSPDDRTSWEMGPFSPMEILRDAFETLTAFPELTR
jgi:hypothetical protein